MNKVNFHIGSGEDQEEVVEFLNKHFLPHEPMNISIDLLPSGYKIPFFDDMVRRHLELDSTLVLLARNQDQELLGLAVFVNEKWWKFFH